MPFEFEQSPLKLPEIPVVLIPIPEPQPACVYQGQNRNAKYVSGSWRAISLQTAI